MDFTFNWLTLESQIIFEKKNDYLVVFKGYNWKIDYVILPS